MNQEDILKLAEELFEVCGDNIYFKDINVTKKLTRFAELVAQHEKVESINACIDVGYKYRCLYKGWEPFKGNEDGCANPHIDGMSDGAYECVEAIRAMGTK